MRKIQLDGRKIKELRASREYGSTQKEFSHEIRISEPKLRAVENDLDAVSTQVADRIAGALKKPLRRRASRFSHLAAGQIMKCKP
jgi:hypothetical protein